MSRGRLREYTIKVEYTACTSNGTHTESVVHEITETSVERANRRAKEYTKWPDSVTSIGDVTVLAIGKR